MKYARQTLAANMSIVAACCFLLPATAGSQAKEKGYIQSEIRKMDKAAINKDADGYVAFTHPDFVNFDKNGQETTHGKEERRKKLAGLFARAIKVSGSTTVTHVSFTKQGAVVDKDSTMSLTMTRNGQTMEMKGSGTYRDLWVKSAGVWLQKTSRTITDTTTINGQTVP